QVLPLVRYERSNPVPPDPRSPARLRILVANVLVENAQYTKLARLIEREQPDVVALVEVSQDWLWGLSKIRQRFPYRVEAPYGAMGMSLWLRAPPQSVDPPLRLVSDGWPILHATLDLDGRECHLWLAHPLSPIRRMGQHRGNPELAALAEEVRRTG